MPWSHFHVSPLTQQWKYRFVDSVYQYQVQVFHGRDFFHLLIQMNLNGRGSSSSSRGHDCSPIIDKDRQRQTISKGDDSPTSITTIFMSNDGAEVTWGYNSSCDEHLENVRDSALLDGESSPTKSFCKNATDCSLRDSPQRLSFCGIRIGSEDSKDKDDSKASRSLVSAFKENRISSYWSSAVNMDEICGGWQSSYFPSITEDTPESSTSSSQVTKLDQDQFGRGVGKATRHRTLNVSARNERLASLRHKLYPFQELEGEGNELLFKKTRSFTATKSDKTSLKCAPTKTSGWMASLDCEHILNEHYKSQSPVVIRYRRVVEDYESDPEDFTKNRKTKSCSKPVLDHSTSSIPDMCERSIDDARWVVQKFLNQRHTFVVHDPTRRESQVVQVWIERGQFLHNQMLAPRFVWCRKSRQSPKNWNQLQQKDKLASIDLLDIKRILDVPSIDRELFPFAKRERCVRIKTLESSWIFEAASKSEQEYFAISLKLTVSRLATLLIVSDAQMMDEFFNDFDEDWK